jgi:hypothetical protein
MLPMRKEKIFVAIMAIIAEEESPEERPLLRLFLTIALQ